MQHIHYLIVEFLHYLGKNAHFRKIVKIYHHAAFLDYDTGPRHCNLKGLCYAIFLQFVPVSFFHEL